MDSYPYLVDFSTRVVQASCPPVPRSIAVLPYQEEGAQDGLMRLPGVIPAMNTAWQR